MFARFGLGARQLVHASITAVLVLSLLGTIWYSGGPGNRAAGHRTTDDGAAGRWPNSPSADLDDEPIEPRQAEIASLPTCVEVKRALQQLEAARDQLLREAALGKANSEPASESAAAHRYQRAIQAVRQGLERMQSRLTPDEYSWFLATYVRPNREETRTLPEQQLGLLPGRGQ